MTANNHYGHSLGFGDHFVKTEATPDPLAFGSHINEFGHGTIPVGYLNDFIFYKFHCIRGSKPNVEEAVKIDDETDLATETAIGGPFEFIDATDAVNIANDPAPVAADGATELVCKLGFFYIKITGVVTDTPANGGDWGKLIRIKLTDSNAIYNFAM